MKNSLKSAIISVFSMSCCACIPSPSQEQIMPPLQYIREIGVHLPKNAYLYWQHGMEQAGSSSDIALSGPEGIVAATIQAQLRKNNPSRYNFTYGKAQQAVFITSLRDTLARQHVFKSTELTTDPAKTKPQDVLITVYFKSTRVGNDYQHYKITLTAVMTIKSNKSLFTRTYVANSDEDDNFSSNTYLQQQTYVSQQLFIKLLNGIKQWAK